MKTRHQGTIACPVCQGQGKLSEDPKQYDFVTRDPQTNICLICGGSGFISPRKLLPDGRKAAELSFRPATRDLTRSRKVDVPVDQSHAEASLEPLQPEPAPSLGHTTQVKKQAAEESPVGEFTFELHRRGIVGQHPSPLDPLNPPSKRSPVAPASSRSTSVMSTSPPSSRRSAPITWPNKPGLPTARTTSSADSSPTSTTFTTS